MAYETNVFSVKMELSLLKNYLEGKRVVDITTDEMAMVFNGALVEEVETTMGNLEIVLTLRDIGVVFFERARVVTAE